MDSIPKLRHSRLSLNLNRSSFPTSLSPSLSFSSIPPAPPQFLPPSSFKSPLILRASTNDSSFNNPHKTPSLPNPFQALAPLFETTCIVIAATAFFFMRFHHPVIAATLSTPPATVESTQTETTNSEETERAIEERLAENPNDSDALRALMEVKIRARKIHEAIGLIDRLIEIEPEEIEWPLFKANLYSYHDDHETAKKLFEEILKKDPVRVEAFHGLVMATTESNEPLKDLLKRVEQAMESCKKQKRDSDVRDFRLLVAQIKVMEGNFTEALKACQDLIKEEPRDFRPYLCQGVIYTLLRKKDEAEKQFDKFQSLVPENHPYKEYFDDKLYATKFYSQKLEREGAGARS